EPNGYLHVGHAKSICLNFGIAEQYGGTCHLRFDDTNPTTENVEFVEAIQSAVRWLGFDWGEHLYHASDYFERLYEQAVYLIEQGKAYVCSLSEEEVRSYRGTVTEAGTDSPYRSRSMAENLDLFSRMRAGEFPEGAHVLRAKIDMAAANMKMRDPLLYRIKVQHHYRTGDAWCIYPLYDFTHCLSDAFEGITHPLCTLEFENNRALYDWVIDNAKVDHKPKQIEFARLNLNYTLTSKRKLAALVHGGQVEGWDDPRMATLAGMRRRGYTAESIRALADMVGVAKNNSVVDFGKLEYCIRDDLNTKAPRAMCVLDPLEVVIENYPEDRVEQVQAPSFPPDVGKPGSRQVPFSRVVYIERDDFMEEPPKKFFRLAPGREVRLRFAYVIKCVSVVKDDAGQIVQLRCTYDPDTQGATLPKGRKVKGTLHWVSAAHAVKVEVRLYDRLFNAPEPEGTDDLNPDSLRALAGCAAEPSLAQARPGDTFQFERQGYFAVDGGDCAADSAADWATDALVFNRVVTLRDSWAKLQSAQPAAPLTAPGPAQRGGSAPTKRVARPQPSRPEPSAPSLSPAAEAQVARYRDELGLTEADAVIIAQEPAVTALFEAAIARHDNPKGIANWVVNELAKELKAREAGALPFGGEHLGELVALIDAGTISGKIAKDVLAEMLESGDSPRKIVAARGLEQVDSAADLEPVIDQIIADNPDPVARYRAGKTSLLGFFVGAVMKATKGQANPQLTRGLLQRKLS
ncbi:MAG: glutamine--tRNA ligase/YqeY domain fusion protein, partial [Deltaproteobacteria bacterium]|nr:glutamine--tRNA ligase/YqeY domain fusion protein [Deltaproteobacteria bacterium]